MGNVVHRGSHTDLKSRYKLKEEIGRGSFAVVRRAVSRSEPKQEYAVKIISKRHLNAKELQLVHDEAVTMFEVSHHPYCCRLFEVYETSGDDGKIYMIMELLAGGNLFHKVVEEGAFSERQARLFMWQVTDAVRFLHSQGIAHRDIKPENFLFARYPYQFPVKLTDFGLSRFVRSDIEVMRTGCGTPGYCAPEVLRRRPYTNAVDMWSLGVVFYIVLSGLTPFHSPHGTQATYERIKRCAYTFNDPQWDHVSTSAKDLIRSLLVLDAGARLTAAEVLRHPWMHGLDDEDRAELLRLPIADNIRPYLDAGPDAAVRRAARPADSPRSLDDAGAGRKTSYTYVAHGEGENLKQLTFIKSFAHFDKELYDAEPGSGDANGSPAGLAAAREDELREMAEMVRRADEEAAAAEEEEEEKAADPPRHIDLERSHAATPTPLAPPAGPNGDAAVPAVVHVELPDGNVHRFPHRHRHHHHHRRAAGHFDGDSCSGSSSEGSSDGEEEEEERIAVAEV